MRRTTKKIKRFISLWQQKVKQRRTEAIKFVQLVSLGLNVHLTVIPVLTLIWLQANTAKIQTTQKNQKLKNKKYATP